MNYPHSTRKLALAVAVASSVLLAGCDTSNEKVEATPRSDTQSFVPGVAPIFNPFVSEVPFNIDLVFNGSTDGTANVSSPANPVVNALNALDGFSTSAYFDVLLNGSVDPSTVKGSGLGQSVFLVPLTTNPSMDVLSPASITGVDSASVAETQIRAEVVSLDGVDNAIRIIPLQPLKSAKKYLVILTNDILDASGRATTPSGSYFAIRDVNNDSLNPALLPVRTLINSAWEAPASGFLANYLSMVTGSAVTAAEAQAKITLAYTFTTSDPNKPLIAMAAPRAALVQAQTALGIAAPDAINNAAGLEAVGLLSTPTAREIGLVVEADLGGGPQDLGVDLSVPTGLASGVGSLYTGYIKLPYYLTAPSSPSDTTYTQQSWKADQVLGSQLTAALPPGAPALPPADIDGTTYNVTYRYPFAARTSDQSVPLQVTLPNPAYVSANPAFGGSDCGTVRGASGYPVVIYVHGITSDRTSVVALAHALSSVCVATVAIDLALHGVTNDTASTAYALNVENTTSPTGYGNLFAVLYGADAPSERHFNDAGGSGAQFINLITLGNTRDNLRQSVMDLLNLNASLDDINDALDAQGRIGLDTSDVKVVGVSLGGIVGTVFATVNQLAIGAEEVATFTSNLNPLGGLVVSTGGSQLTQVLLNSDTFAPVINGGLGAAGITPGTVNYERFIYTAQSTVDSGDPVNFASTLAGLGVPVLVQQVVGGGDASALPDPDTKEYTSDRVVPNVATVTGAPLAGTTALAELLNAAQVGPGAQDLTAGNGLVNLTIGHHVSLLRPSQNGVDPATTGENIATAELQTQVVSFVLSTAAQVAVGSAPSNTNTAAQFIEAPAP